MPRIGVADAAVGEADHGAGAGWDVDVEPQDVAVEAPGAADRAVGAVVLGLGPGEAAAEAGLDDEAAVPGLAEADPGDVRVQEGDDRTLAVVVERPLCAAVGDAVPPLPDRGGVAVVHLQPGRDAGGE